MHDFAIRNALLVDGLGSGDDPGIFRHAPAPRHAREHRRVRRPFFAPQLRHGRGRNPPRRDRRRGRRDARARARRDARRRDRLRDQHFAGCRMRARTWRFSTTPASGCICSATGCASEARSRSPRPRASWRAMWRRSSESAGAARCAPEIGPTCCFSIPPAWGAGRRCACAIFPAVAHGSPRPPLACMGVWVNGVRLGDSTGPMPGKLLRDFAT